MSPKCNLAAPILKVHDFCYFSLAVELWSSWLPARSLAPVVTTALYLVFAASSVEDVPNGFSIAFVTDLCVKV